MRLYTIYSWPVTIVWRHLSQHPRLTWLCELWERALWFVGTCGLCIPFVTASTPSYHHYSIIILSLLPCVYLWACVFVGGNLSLERPSKDGSLTWKKLAHYIPPVRPVSPWWWIIPETSTLYWTFWRLNKSVVRGSQTTPARDCFSTISHSH